MTNEQILALVQAYGDECSKAERFLVALAGAKKEHRASNLAAANDAMRSKRKALRAIEIAVASIA